MATTAPNEARGRAIFVYLASIYHYNHRMVKNAENKSLRNSGRSPGFGAESLIIAKMLICCDVHAALPMGAFFDPAMVFPQGSVSCQSGGAKKIGTGWTPF